MANQYLDEHDNWSQLSSLIDRARQYYKDQRYEAAIGLYHQILAFDELDYKQRANVLAELGYCYYYVGDFDSSVRTLRAVLELDQDYEPRSSVFRILGASYFALEDYSRSLQYREKALACCVDPKERKLLIYELGRSHLFTGNGEKARAYLTQFLEYIGESESDEKMDTMYNLGFAYIQLKKRKQAEKSFRYLIDHHRNAEDLARGYYGLTELACRMHKFDKVKDLAEKTLDILPDFSERETLLFYRILAYLKIGERGKASALTRDFLSEFPQSRYRNELNSLL